MVDIIYIGLAVFIATTIGTIAGFGTSTILIPLLTLFLPLKEIIFLVGIIHWFGGIWKIELFKKGLRWDIIALFSIPGFITTIIGAILITYAELNWLIRLFGTFLILYTITIIFKPHFYLLPSKKNLSFGGALSGFFAGLFGMGGAIRALFLNIFNLPKSVYLATSGVIALVIDTTRLTTYYISGLSISSKFIYGLILFIPLSFLGAFFAKSIVDRLPQNIFRLIVAVFLGLVGMKFLIFGK